MQAEGYNLKAIERLVHGATGAAEEALGFKRALLAPFGDEQPEYVTQDELDRRFNGPFEPKVLRKVEKLRPAAAAGRRALRGAEPHAAASRRGAGRASAWRSTHVLAVAEQVLRHSRAVAQSFVRLFVDDVLDRLPPPAVRTPRPSGRACATRSEAAPARQRRALAAFQQTMTYETERRFTPRARQVVATASPLRLK